MNTSHRPRRELSAHQLEFLAIGSAIGSGLFVGISQGLRIAGPSLVLAYAVCAVVVYVIARCLAEMSLADRENRTFVDHVRSQLGPRFGFVCGWSFWLTLLLIGMAELTAIGLLVRVSFPIVPQWIVVATALAGLLALNVTRVGIFGESEVWLSSLKIVTIGAFIVLGLVASVVPKPFGLTDANVSNLWKLGGVFPNGFAGFAAVMPVALFAFGGFEIISLAAAEAKDPMRSIPRAVNGLIARFFVFYLGSTVALLILIPWTEVMPGTSPFLVVLEHMRLPFAAAFVNLILITAVLSSCNAVLFAATRTLRALALNADAPILMATLNGNGAPAAALVVTAASISLAVGLNSMLPKPLFGILIQMVSILTAVNWAFIVIAELRFRRRKSTNALPIFAVPWTPWSNGFVIAFVVAVLALLASDSASLPVFALASLLLTTLGSLSMSRHRGTIEGQTIH